MTCDRVRAGAALPPLGEGLGVRALRRARPLPSRPLVARARPAFADRPHARMTAPAFRVDGVPASREAFYAVACDPARSCVVEACAGSGKTWMLVSRMLRALLDGVAPHEILAITFTRAAAGEMRQAAERLARASIPRRARAMPSASGRSSAWRRARAGRIARRRTRDLARPRPRGRPADRDPNLPCLVRAAPARRADGVARPSRPGAGHRADRGSRRPPPSGAARFPRRACCAILACMTTTRR